MTGLCCPAMSSSIRSTAIICRCCPPHLARPPICLLRNPNHITDDLQRKGCSGGHVGGDISKLPPWPGAADAVQGRLSSSSAPGILTSGLPKLDDLTSIRTLHLPKTSERANRQSVRKKFSPQASRHSDCGSPLRGPYRPD